MVVLSGGATISDGAILDLQVLSDLQLGKSYTILQTAQGASGSIAVGGDGFTVVDNLDKPLLERVVFYSADAVTVAFQELSAPWSTLVATPNQAAAANAVQSLRIGNPLLESAVLLDRDQLDATFDLLSGEINATAKGVLIRDSSSCAARCSTALSPRTGPAGRMKLPSPRLVMPPGQRHPLLPSRPRPNPRRHRCRPARCGRRGSARGVPRMATATRRSSTAIRAAFHRRRYPARCLAGRRGRRLRSHHIRRRRPALVG